MSQDRFTTSRELYHRIRWDPRLDAREFVIGYDAHAEELEEMPFEAFVPDGEIPWHRVWYFRRGPEVVWDRRKRIDALNTLTPAAPEEPTPPAPVPPPQPPHHHEKHPFTPLPSYRYDAKATAWLEAPQPPASSPEELPSPTELTVASLNVLFDLYEPELLDAARRTVAAISLLRSVDADLIALQEVTPSFLRALLDTPWIREHFFLSEGPAATTVTPYGQLLLSRFPFASLSQSVFSRDKRIIAGELALRGGPLWVATLHLTSNVDPRGDKARAAQIQVLLDRARWIEAHGHDAPDLLVAGDFNFGDDAHEVWTFAEAGFTDVWTALHPGDPGFSYDPSRNALAALMSRSGRGQRFDRVLVRSASGRLTPRQVSFFGEEPLSGPPSPGGAPLFVSDHFGLRCTLLRGAPSRKAPVPRPEQGPPRVLPVPPVHQAEVVRAVLETRGEWESDDTRQRRATAMGRLKAICSRLGLQLHPYGSHVLGTGSERSDVEAVAVGPSHLSREDFAQALLEALPHHDRDASGRFVAGAAIPLVKLTLKGVHFDVAYASRPEGVEPCPPAELLARHGEQLDAASFRSLTAWADTHALLEAVEREGAGLEHFRVVLRAVRAWARARGVSSHALGYLGGLSWAVMAAWSCMRAPREAASTDEHLLAHFFETFAAWPWPQPVTVTPETAHYRPEGERDLMPVVAPALPPRNTARNVSRSTLRVLREELARAAELVHEALARGTEAAWEALFAPAELSREAPVLGSKYSRKDGRS